MAAMGYCPRCHGLFPGLRYCPDDGQPLLDTKPEKATGGGSTSNPTLTADPDLPASPEEVDPYLGTVISNRYKILRRIGEGGMGTVYMVENMAMGIPMAMKILHRDLCTHKHAVHRFEREARSASRLCHPNNIQVLDFGTHHDGSLYLVMEYLKGKDLFDTLRDQRYFDVSRAAKVARQICAGLAEAHDKGIIHRDLKPENIFLIHLPEEPDFVKILDFGIAKVLETDPGEPTITVQGTVFGTPEYLAPEQAEAGRVDHRADLYSVGIILFRMLVGRLPFWAPNKIALLQKQLYERPPTLEEMRPPQEVSPDMKTVIYRLLEKRPSQRYQSAQDMIAALDEADLRPEAERLANPRPEKPIVWIQYPDLSHHQDQPTAPEEGSRAPSGPLKGQPVKRALIAPQEEDKATRSSFPSSTTKKVLAYTGITTALLASAAGLGYLAAVLLGKIL